MGIERFDSQGGKDLYVSFKMESGNWSEPLNIGSTVNTSHDEYSPYLAPDNETLYFSSKGFSGFGGSDVYITRRLDNTWKNWSDPENLGPDINSEEDEVFFNITPSGQQAYFAKGTGANADIYRIDIPVFYQPSPVITVRGLVKEQTSEKPLSAQVLFTLMPENTQIGLTISDSASGEFNIVLPSGAKYIYTTQADGYKSATQEIDLMKNPERHEYQEVVWLEPEQAVLALVNDDQTKTENTTQETPPIQEPAATGTKQRQAQQEETQPSAQQPKNALALKIYFYFDSNELSKEQKRDLKSVYEEIKVLKADIKVEIAGHTDNVGSEFYNVILSERRAKAVQDYLISLGLTAERLVVKGYGESQPAATNNHLEGRRLNRRVEFVPQN
ncbi:MAG: OmpA family protein [Cytophagales bacterium]|nr:OmpA family protein [Cytophagales bacterium]